MIYPEDKREDVINILTEELPMLRAKLGISQENLCDIVGISRQTYSGIETKKKKMSWSVFLSLLMLFTNNEKTAPIIRIAGAFPDDLNETKGNYNPIYDKPAHRCLSDFIHDGSDSCPCRGHEDSSGRLL